MMKGLNIEATLDLANNINIPVIASGGVSCIEDIHKISSYKIQEFLELSLAELFTKKKLI